MRKLPTPKLKGAARDYLHPEEVERLRQLAPGFDAGLPATVAFERAGLSFWESQEGEKNFDAARPRRLRVLVRDGRVTFRVGPCSSQRRELQSVFWWPWYSRRVWLVLVTVSFSLALAQPLAVRAWRWLWGQVATSLTEDLRGGPADE